MSLLARSVQLAKRLATQPCDTGGASPSDPRTCCSFIGGGTHRVCKVIPRVTALGFSVNYDVKEAPTEVAAGTKYLVKCRMDIQLLHIKIVQTFHADGFQATIRKAFVHLTRRRTTDDFDLRHGTDTAGIEPLWRFEIRSPNARFGVRYQTTGEQELVDTLKCLHEDPHAFTFIDLGCGKGRALLVASNLGFIQVIGGEFARANSWILRE